MSEGGKEAIRADEEVVGGFGSPPARGARARARTASGSQDHGGRDPQGGARPRTGKKTDLAVAIAKSRRFPVKTVAATLQVARSNLIERRDGSRPQRGPQNRAGDFDLVADIRRLVDQRPTYGYRRIAALLKRERRSAGRPARQRQAHLSADEEARTAAGALYRPTADQASTTARSSRSAQTSAGAADALEFTCWNGEIVRVAFVLDCHDREVIAWVATTAGISGEMIRDMMVECVEHRFGGIRAPHKVQWLTDNGSIFAAYKTIEHRAGAEPRTLLHPSRKSGEQRHGRGLRQNAQTRLRPGEPDLAMPQPHSLKSIAGWRTTTLFTRTPGWAIAHRENTSMLNPNPPRVRSDRVNSTLL